VSGKPQRKRKIPGNRECTEKGNVLKRKAQKKRKKERTEKQGKHKEKGKKESTKLPNQRVLTPLVLFLSFLKKEAV